MKVLFTTNVFEKYLNREPLGMMYLSAMLRRNGHEVSACGTTQHDIFREFDSFKPDIVAYSITTGFHKSFLALNQRLKKKRSFLSVFGGPHATFFPELINEPGIDAICRGEGENALLELTSLLAAGKPIINVANFWVKTGDGVFKNGPRPLEDRLESLPHPDRELFYKKFPAARAAKIKSVITIRGCPYSCSYCFNKSFNDMYRGLGKVIRKREVDDVIAEIDEIRVNYPLDLIYFVTDNFVLDKEWLGGFVAKYKRRIHMPFHCLVSADLVDLETARLLKDAGCVSVMMGIECGNDKIRRDILNRNISKSSITGAIEHLKNAGIRVCSQNMLGIPGGSLETDIETYCINRDTAVDYSVVSLVQPYPKTGIHDIAEKMGLLKNDIRDIGEAYYDKSPLDIPDKKKIERMQKLFAVGVALKLPERVMILLASLPLGWLYAILYRAWKGYCGKAMIFPHRTSPYELVRDSFKYIFKPGVR